MDLSYIGKVKCDPSVGTPTEQRDQCTVRQLQLRENGNGWSGVGWVLLLTSQMLKNRAAKIPNQNSMLAESFEALAKLILMIDGSNGGVIGSFNPSVFGEYAAGVEQAVGV